MVNTNGERMIFPTESDPENGRTAESPMERPAPWIAAALAFGITVDRFRPEWTPDRCVPLIFAGLAVLWLIAKCGRRLRRGRVILATGAVLAAISLFGATIHHIQFRRFPVTDVGLRIPEGAPAKVEGQ
ncbi:MAG: hypothetical protein Q4C47_04135, partial [Planctomycetia bacterium]|nr:hypothetical protein [Planctomycetia bacterium]